MSGPSPYYLTESEALAYLGLPVPEAAYLTVPEAAIYLRLSIRQVQHLIKLKRIEVKRGTGKRYRLVRRSSLDALEGRPGRGRPRLFRCLSI